MIRSPAHRREGKQGRHLRIAAGEQFVDVDLVRVDVHRPALADPPPLIRGVGRFPGCLLNRIGNVEPALFKRAAKAGSPDSFLKREPPGIVVDRDASDGGPQVGRPKPHRHCRRQRGMGCRQGRHRGPRWRGVAGGIPDVLPLVG